MSEVQNSTAGLIPIREHGGQRAVSGRELHAFLEVGAEYRHWFPRMVEYGFTEGGDYAVISDRVAREGRGSVERTDHAITLDMAKELAMIQRTERGKQARQYFIEVEKRSKAPVLDISTPEGVLALAQTLTKTAEELVAAKNEVAELAPLASQARTFNRRKGNVGRQEFARDIVAWAVDNGYRGVTAGHVYAFLGGRRLDMFIHDKFRRDHGNASASGIRRGLSFTHKGVSPTNGHEFEQGMLLPKGYEYAWSRIENYINEHGHLELPRKEIAA